MKILSARSLDVSYRRDGHPDVAYLSFEHKLGARVHRSEHPHPWMLIDFGRDATPLGIEFLDPSAVDERVVSAILRLLGVPDLGPDERSGPRFWDHWPSFCG